MPSWLKAYGQCKFQGIDSYCGNSTTTPFQFCPGGNDAACGGRPGVGVENCPPMLRDCVIGNGPFMTGTSGGLYQILNGDLQRIPGTSWGTFNSVVKFQGTLFATGAGGGIFMYVGESSGGLTNLLDGNAATRGWNDITVSKIGGTEILVATLSDGGEIWKMDPNTYQWSELVCVNTTCNTIPWLTEFTVERVWSSSQSETLFATLKYDAFDPDEGHILALNCNANCSSTNLVWLWGDDASFASNTDDGNWGDICITPSDGTLIGLVKNGNASGYGSLMYWVNASGGYWAEYPSTRGAGFGAIAPDMTSPFVWATGTNNDGLFVVDLVAGGTFEQFPGTAGFSFSNVSTTFPLP